MDFVINIIMSYGKDRVHHLMKDEERFIKEAVNIEMAKLGHDQQSGLLDWCAE